MKLNHIRDKWDKAYSQCYIIAEMSANHGGSKEHAKEIIHAAKEAGADCIKIQTYTPDTMTICSNKPYFQIEHGTWSRENLYDLYKKAYTPWEWQAELKEAAEKIGLEFLSTPFDKTSVDFLEEIGIQSYKIASFELVDIPLLEYIASKGKPMILSTGMSTLEEIKEAVRTVNKNGINQVALLKCSSAYPAINDNMNLKTIQHMKQIFRVPVGLSDHTLGSVSAIAAVSLGADIVEKHFCISRSITTPDSSFSMEQDEFKKMICNIREAEKALGEVHYGAVKEERANLAFRRSIFAVKDIQKGDTFTEENIRVIRPGYGLPPKYYKNIIGTQSRQNIEAGTPIGLEMTSGPIEE